MTIAAGKRLGPYEILAAIGAGGMGEVYKARDTRLDRIVAIKVLPPHFADRPELRDRFEREARTIANLKHPHICVLYDIGHEDGTHYLVMEYLEGETLAERLKRGPLPLNQVLDYAIEIADALDTAHRQHFTHRDIKPANIMLTKTAGTKLLDFGLAKLKQEVDPAIPPDERPTNMGLTAEGTILGTLQYMAPEQVEGRTDDIDARTDIFAFGATVYEMATGKKAFEGKSRASVIAAILEREVPPISSLQPMSPPTLDRVVKKCLAKEREKRWQSASDLHDELEWIKEGGQEAAKAASPETKPAITWRRAGVLSFAALVIGAAIASIATWTLKPSPTQPVSRVTINLPPGQRLAGLELAAIAFSPDGTQLAYVANRGGVQQLFLRDLDSLEAKPLPGTEGAVSPFFSPDGQWLGFFADQKLKKVSVTGGAPAVLAAAGANGRGGTWGRNGHIIFAPQTESGLWQVPASGGTPEVLTTLDPNKGEGSHRYPHHLPGGKAILFTVGTGGGWDEARIEALRLDTGERKVLIEGGSDARYVSSGHLTYIRAGTLMAVPFDLNRLEVTGLPVAVEEGVLPSTDNTGSAQAGFSALGWLVYVPGGGARPDERTLVWVDHKGTEQALALPPRPYRAPRVSPDGRRLVMDIDQGNKQDVWVYDISRGTLTRLTYEGSSAFPVWTPDGKKVTFQSRRGRPWNLYWKPGDGSGGEERLTTSEYGYITASWTPDGQMLAFVEVHPTTGRDIGVLSLIEERKATPFLRTPFNEVEPAFSPDGRWLAYAADESGRNEVYVQPFPGGGQKWQISTEGGSEPVWARDGRELFYRNGDKMMAVSITTQPAFRATKPELLFERHYHSLPPAVTRNYDIAPDGRRFLMVKASDQAAIVTHLNVVLNWFEELKRKVPVK